MPAGFKAGGRVKGTPNKATSDIRELAQVHGPAVINRLLMLSGCAIDALGHPIKGAEAEATQVMAMKELLDRGYGKSPQAITGADGGALHLIVTGVRRALDEAADE